MIDTDKTLLGIITDPTKNRANHIDNFFSIGIPLLGTLIALVLLPWFLPSETVLALFAFGLVITTLGTTVGLHRYFTHRSYKTSTLVHLILAFFGTIAMQGSVIRWVADHRRHHRFTDQPGDMHSPYFDSRGVAITSKLRGLWHSHTGWMFTSDMTDESRYAADLQKDQICIWFSKYYWFVNATFILSCGGLCYAITNDLMQGVLGLLYAGCFRVTLIHQFTWAVNSIGHTYGSRVQGSSDRSTNNFLLAILTLGDGLHSSHHVKPARGVNPPVYSDIGGMLLIALERAGLIWQLKR